MTAANLFEQQAANRRRSAWLTAAFVLFTAWVGFGGDLAWYLFTRDAPRTEYHHVVPFIGLAAMAIAAGIAWFSWRFGAKQVLTAAGAVEVTEPTTPEQRVLVNVVEEMAIASGLPKPRIWIVPDSDPNAFATGTDPAAAHLAVTQGLLAALNRDELQGVVAHEMAHVRNFDIRLMTLLAGMVGAIVLLSDVMRNFLRFGGPRPTSKSNSKKGNPLAVIVLVLWLVSLIIAPIVARLLAMAVSRKREFLADATGAELTRNPQALAAALGKLDQAVAPTRSIARGAAHMCIVDPAGPELTSAAAGLFARFASHPPIAERMARLKAMAYLGSSGSAA